MNYHKTAELYNPTQNNNDSHFPLEFKIFLYIHFNLIATFITKIPKRENCIINIISIQSQENERDDLKIHYE